MHEPPLLNTAGLVANKRPHIVLPPLPYSATYLHVGLPGGSGPPPRDSTHSRSTATVFRLKYAKVLSHHVSHSSDFIARGGFDRAILLDLRRPGLTWRHGVGTIDYIV